MKEHTQATEKQSEEAPELQDFREYPFSVWIIHLLIAGFVVWIGVLGMRALHQRQAHLREARLQSERACGSHALQERAAKHKGYRLLLLEDDKMTARWNTQEAQRPEDWKGWSATIWQMLGRAQPNDWLLIPSGYWISSKLSLAQQRTLAYQLQAHCGVHTVLSRAQRRSLLLEQGREIRLLAKYAQNPLPSTAPSTPTPLLRFPLHTPLGFLLAHTDEDEAKKPLETGKIKARLALRISEDALRHAPPLPPKLYIAALRYQCRLIVKAGGQLFPPCQFTLRTLKAPIRPTIPQIAIPAGAFWMREGKPAQVIALPSFAIDQSEVSREEYALCALAGKCSIPSDVFSGRWREPQDRLRIDDAKRFCAWMGRKLPTEAQWIKAARGGHEIHNGIANPLPRRPFPWGEHPPSCRDANLRWCFVEKRGKHEIPALLPTERFLRDISPYGVRMMAGNTAEIVREGHIKGGSAFSPPQDIDAKGRIELGEGLRWVGFRCVTEP